MEDYEISIDNKEIQSIKELIPNIFSSGIIDSLKLLTKYKTVDYYEYIMKIKKY